MNLTTRRRKTSSGSLRAAVRAQVAKTTTIVVLVVVVLTQCKLFASGFVVGVLPCCNHHPPHVTNTIRKQSRTLSPVLSLKDSASDNNNDNSKKGGGSTNTNTILDFLFNPYESKIPKEVEKEIYEAEGNTAAAKDRGVRIAFYTVIAVIGVMAAFFNAFLSELRSSSPTTFAQVEDAVLQQQEPFDLSSSAFAWVQDNFLFQFLFLNKIGGGLMLLFGAGAGLLAESEFDSRRLNAERIWEELQRRRSEAANKQAKKEAEFLRNNSKNKPKSSLGKKKAKRLTALSEVVLLEDQKREEQSPPTAAVNAGASTTQPMKAETAAKETSSGGIFQGIKDMYEKADAMAASQALLLNKQLEDAGLIEKITDETGLKVIGKENAATKIKDQSEDLTSSTDSIAASKKEE